MASSRWPVTCQPAYPPALLPISLPPSLSLSPFPGLRTPWNVFCFPRTNFLFPDSSLLLHSILAQSPALFSVFLSVCRPACLCALLFQRLCYIEPGHCLGGFAPQDQWEGLIEYTRYELHVILRQRREKKGGERRVLHTPCLWPLPHPDTALAGLSWQVYTLNHDITCAVLRGIHGVISDYLSLGP